MQYIFAVIYGTLCMSLFPPSALQCIYQSFSNPSLPQRLAGLAVQYRLLSICLFSWHAHQSKRNTKIVTIAPVSPPITQAMAHQLFILHFIAHSSHCSTIIGNIERMKMSIRFLFLSYPFLYTLFFFIKKIHVLIVMHGNKNLFEELEGGG